MEALTTSFKLPSTLGLKSYLALTRDLGPSLSKGIISLDSLFSVIGSHVLTYRKSTGTGDAWWEALGAGVRLLGVSLAGLL